MSSHALQVRFLHLAPSEGLIALAAAHYKQMRLSLSGPDECTVSIERDAHENPLAHAVVRIHERGLSRAEASASHHDAEVALGMALQGVHAQLAALTPTLGAVRAQLPPLRIVASDTGSVTERAVCTHAGVAARQYPARRLVKACATG